MSWAYLLRCGDGTLYAGWTKDLQKRLAAHRAGKGAKYTRGRGPLRLAWACRYETQGQAMAQEALLKRMSKAEKEILVQAYQGEEASPGTDL